MSTTIHSTAVIAPGAEIDDGVVIGPYCTVGPEVKIGARTVLRSHVNVDGVTTLGEDNEVFPFASVGSRAQDLKYKGGKPRLRVGDHNVIRESATINAATADGDETVVGNHCLLMAYSHVAHDCVLGDGVILANAATLAGHVIVEDGVGIGGLSAVHQFVRLGKWSYIGGYTGITQDVLPFTLAVGYVPGRPIMINREGLKRRGVSTATMTLLRRTYKILCREGLSTPHAITKAEAEVEQVPEVKYMIDFARNSRRGFAKYRAPIVGATGDEENGG